MKAGDQSGHGGVGGGHLREEEVGLAPIGLEPGHRSAPVELPVPQREDEDVGYPHRHRRVDEVPTTGPGMAVCHGQQLVDELAQRHHVGQVHEGDERDGDGAQSQRLASEAGIGDQQRCAEDALEGGDEPARPEARDQLVGKREVQGDRARRRPAMAGHRGSLLARSPHSAPSRRASSELCPASGLPPAPLPEGAFRSSAIAATVPRSRRARRDPP